MKKIGVIGLGNPLRRDDGIGIILLERVQKDKKIFPKDIEFIDGGTGGMNLLHLLAHFDAVIIIDAVLFKGKPGEIRFFHRNDVLNKNALNTISTHEADFLQILHLSKNLSELPSQLFIFGVQPKDLSYGSDLSPALKSVLPQLYKKLVTQIKTLILDRE
jgi:hydrogenase maturation protease